MKRMLVLCSLMLFMTTLQSQDYQTAIGIRGGPEVGITAKHYITSISAIEGIVHFRYEGVNFTAVYEINNDNAFGVERLNWYYGAGGHIGFYDNNPWERNSHSTAIIGADGIIGIEYNISEAPINFSLDWKPVINLIGHQGFVGDNGALSIRYYF